MWRKLANDHVLLLAPRRGGQKPLLMYRLRNEARRTGGPHRSLPECRSRCPKRGGFCEGGSIVPSQKHRQPALLLSFRAAPQIQAPNARFLLSASESVGVPDLFEVGLRQGATRSMEGKRRACIDRRAAWLLAGQWLIMVDQLPIFVLALLRRRADTTTGSKRFLTGSVKPDKGRRKRESLRWLLAGSKSDLMCLLVCTISLTQSMICHSKTSMHSVPEVSDRFLSDLWRKLRSAALHPKSAAHHHRNAPAGQFPSTYNSSSVAFWRCVTTNASRRRCRWFDTIFRKSARPPKRAWFSMAGNQRFGRRASARRKAIGRGAAQSLCR